MSQTGAAKMFGIDRQPLYKIRNKNKRKRTNHRGKKVSMEQQAKMWKKPW